MQRQDIINILFTFFVGFFSGAYLYLTVFAPTVQQVEIAVEEHKEIFVITGEAYGGCQRAGSCPSFNVADNGRYKYVQPARDVAEQVVREGVLPLDIQQKLHRYATEVTLTQQSEPGTPDMCDSYVDGVDVRYTIERGARVYTLDSCGTAVDQESALWRELSSVWEYLQTTS